MNVTNIYLMVISALICYSAVKDGSYLYEAKLYASGKTILSPGGKS